MAANRYGQRARLGIPSLAFLGAVAVATALVGPASAQFPGATIGLPADLGSLGSDPSAGGSANRGGTGSRALGATRSRGVTRGRSATGSATRGAGRSGGGGGGGAGIANGSTAAPNPDDTYLNPLYGRGGR